MPVIFVMAATASMAALQCAADPQLQRPSLYGIDELPRPLIRRVQVEAVGRNGANLQYVVERKTDDGPVIGTVTIDGVALPMARLSEQQFPSIDLSTMDVSFEDRTRVAKIKVQFGPPRDCFANHDGRSYASITFKPKGADVQVISFAGCETPH